VTSQNDYFIVRYQRGCLGLNGQWELNGQNRPLIIGNIILLDRIYPTTSFIPSEYVDVRVFKDNSRHGASSLVKIGYSLPSIHVDRIPFAAFKHSINGSATNSVDEVPLICQCVGVSALIQTGLFCANFILCIVHVDRTSHIGKTRIKTSCDQDVSICQSNSN